MPQEQLNGPHIGSTLEQMDGKGVAHLMLRVVLNLTSLMGYEQNGVLGLNA